MGSVSSVVGCNGSSICLTHIGWYLQFFTTKFLPHLRTVAKRIRDGQFFVLRVWSTREARGHCRMLLEVLDVRDSRAVVRVTQGKSHSPLRVCVCVCVCVFPRACACVREREFVNVGIWMDGCLQAVTGRLKPGAAPSWPLSLSLSLSLVSSRLVYLSIYLSIYLSLSFSLFH